VKADSTRNSFQFGGAGMFGGGGASAMKRADDQIAAVKALAERRPETWELATTAADIKRIASADKLQR